MKKGRGRTSRIRRRKLGRSSQSRGVNESYKPEFIALRKWLKARKFEDTNLIPACFPGTGRGLMSKTTLQEGQLIISLPESCLLTTDTVLRSHLGPYIAKWQPPPSPLLALCTFLVAERHAGDRSPWKPYLDVLPKAYTCAVCLEPDVVALLPRPLAAAAREQRMRVRELFTSSRGCFSSLQPLLSAAAESVFSYRAFLWAWCTVNTRAVYMARGRRQGLSAEPDTCALAPFLDLLNHSPAAQVDAAFNEESRCYEIRTRSGCRRREEVFICYGAHDGRRLLLENLAFGWDGPSWRLLTALRLLCLEPAEFLCWKKVLLGEVVSDVNEKKSLDIAQKICRYLMEEASAVLQKVSHMKDKEMAGTHQLTLVETLWAEELKILRASAETLSSLQTAVGDSPGCPAGRRPLCGCDA